MVQRLVLSTLSVSSTSNLGADVTTSSSQTYTGDITLSANVGLNTSGGKVQIDGDVNTTLVSGGSASGIIQFLGNGSYKYSADGGSTYTTATATSSAITLGTGSLTYSGGSYSWTTPSGVTSTKLLVVGGGGSGGSSRSGQNTGAGGGGGAGGLIYNSSYALSETTAYAITVGAGGISGAIGSNGSQGGSSIFNDQTAIGGGYGGAGNDGATYNATTYAEYDLSINTGAGDIDINSNLANLGELNLTSTSAGSEISGIISTDTIVTKAGSGSLTLSGNNTYTGATNIDVGTIIATHANALGSAAGATIVADGASLTISGGLNVAEPVSLSGTGVASAGALVFSSGNNTYSGAITLAADTLIKSTAGTQTLSATINGGYALTTVASDALTFSGVIGATTPLTKVNLSTTSGNLTLANNITVTGTGTDAMIFNAGSNTAAGTTTGGNIIISGSPTLTTGSGGRVTFYTGSVSGSTGLTSLIGSGSYRFRYNSDETTTNYSAALTSGKYAIYREQPTLTVTADNEGLTYGTAPTPTVTITGMQNGDASGTVVTTAASISIGGATSTSGNYTAGSHTITPSAAASTYGYGFDYATGTLTVSQQAITSVTLRMLVSDKDNYTITDQAGHHRQHHCPSIDLHCGCKQ
jgi:fibronectin-binding autotransporter adhesin